MPRREAKESHHITNDPATAFVRAAVGPDRPLVEDAMPAGAVLLIDDNAVQAGVRQTILRRAGYQVFPALSPARALEQLRTGDFPEAVRLVITDHVMPELTGDAFVRELRTSEPDLPVLVITGMAEAETEYEGLGVTFRTKPLMPEALLKTVEELLR